MSILVLSHEYPPVGGGAGASCALLSEQYAAAGHDVTVLTMSYENLPADEVVNGVHVLRQKCGRRRWEMASPAEGLRWARRAWSVALSLHRQLPFDITHAHFIMPAGIVARWLFRKAGLPYVITPRGSDVPGYNRERLKLAHVLARPWWKLIVRDAAQVISPSVSLLDLIQLQTQSIRAAIIPNGVNTARFRPGTKEHRILLCSRLVERKGFQYFLECVQSIDPADWQVDIVGSGPYQPQLEQLAESCLWPVKFHGRIDNRDPQLAELYSRASIFVLPSERENCPVAILEGMTAGCAVVTTNVTGNPEVLGSTGCLVPPRDARALAEVIRSLMQDESQCRTLGASARQRVLDQFEPRQIASRNLAILERCLRRQEVGR
jgi:glycosyltransferase involved in cell wall biosynthesis